MFKFLHNSINQFIILFYMIFAIVLINLILFANIQFENNKQNNIQENNLKYLAPEHYSSFQPEKTNISFPNVLEEMPDITNTHKDLMMSDLRKIVEEEINEFGQKYTNKHLK